MTIDYTWWKDATVYQIWPASFKDSNGDGIGDIPGIISKLDYIKSLGVDVVWLSPAYDSPQDDMGYDISDYEKIYPSYGTVKDADTLISETHKRGMKLIFDLVINHTSSEHKWFKESRSSKTNPKRNWYIWKPAKYDSKGNRHPPNNWRSHFSGSAWEWDEKTGEYYLRLFAKTQPDLNWENEETRKAIYDSAMTFWFEKGVDGFRIDTAGLYSKHQDFPDAPIEFPDKEFQPCNIYTSNGPRIHEFHKEMYANVTSRYDAMTVGEVGNCSEEETIKYVSKKEKEMNMIFKFNTVNLGTHPDDRFKAVDFDLLDFKKTIQEQSEFTEGTDAWTTVFLENHDQPRSVTRFGNDSSKYLQKSAKLLALLQSSLTGTLFIYQGQEIGMTNLPKSWSIEEYKDINTINYFKLFKEAHQNDPDYAQQEAKLMSIINLVARDHARSPVQWDSSSQSGFTTGTPWTRVNDNYKSINVESQLHDPSSVLAFYQKSLAVRKQYRDLFIYGTFRQVDAENPDVFSYTKSVAGSTAYVVLNFSEKQIPFHSQVKGSLSLVHSNVDEINDTTLTPYEGRIYIVN